MRCHSPGRLLGGGGILLQGTHPLLTYMHFHLYLFLYQFFYILKTISSHQYCQFYSNTSGFILVFSLFIFITTFSHSEKLGFYYSQYIYLFDWSPWHVTHVQSSAPARPTLDYHGSPKTADIIFLCPSNDFRTELLGNRQEEGKREER